MDECIERRMDGWVGEWTAVQKDLLIIALCRLSFISFDMKFQVLRAHIWIAHRYILVSQRALCPNKPWEYLSSCYCSWTQEGSTFKKLLLQKSELAKANQLGVIFFFLIACSLSQAGLGSMFQCEKCMCWRRWDPSNRTAQSQSHLKMNRVRWLPLAWIVQLVSCEVRLY